MFKVNLMVTEVPVLALDGPGGSGKGTVASRIAVLKDWRILDSGALYRAFAFRAQQLGVLPDDLTGIHRVVVETDFDFVVEKNGEVGIFVNGDNVTTTLRSSQAGLVAYIGVNSAGIGVCMNTLPAPSRMLGVPHYFTLRGIYQSTSLDDAIEAVHRAKRAISANLILVTPILSKYISFYLDSFFS